MIGTTHPKTIMQNHVMIQGVETAATTIDAKGARIAAMKMPRAQNSWWLSSRVTAKATAMEERIGMTAAANPHVNGCLARIGMRAHRP
jgi:hypothetical protein